MALAPLSDDVKNMSYTELKARVEVLTRRVNSLTQMKISIIGSDQKPSITITETNSTLSIPEATDCSSEVAALEAEIVALEAEIVALETDISDLEGQNDGLQDDLNAYRDALEDETGALLTVTSTLNYTTGTNSEPAFVSAVYFFEADTTQAIRLFKKSFSTGSNPPGVSGEVAIGAYGPLVMSTGTSVTIVQAGGTQGVPSSVTVSLQLKYVGDSFNPPADGSTGTASWEYGG